MVYALLWLLKLIPRVQVCRSAFFESTSEPLEVLLYGGILINVYTAICENYVEAR